MSVEQLESAILGLSSEERQRLAVWFEENRGELLGDDADQLSDEQTAELLRRRDLAMTHPELLEPWDGTIERLRARLNEFVRRNLCCQRDRTHPLDPAGRASGRILSDAYRDG